MYELSPYVMAAVGRLHRGDHAGAVLGAGAGGERGLRGRADLAGPVRADSRQVVGEHEAGAGTVAAVDRGDVGDGQVHAGIQLRRSPGRSTA